MRDSSGSLHVKHISFVFSCPEVQSRLAKIEAKKPGIAQKLAVLWWLEVYEAKMRLVKKRNQEAG